MFQAGIPLPQSWSKVQWYWNALAGIVKSPCWFTLIPLPLPIFTDTTSGLVCLWNARLPYVTQTMSASQKIFWKFISPTATKIWGLEADKEGSFGVGCYGDRSRIKKRDVCTLGRFFLSRPNASHGSAFFGRSLRKITEAHRSGFPSTGWLLTSSFALIFTLCPSVMQIF